MCWKWFSSACRHISHITNVLVTHQGLAGKIESSVLYVLSFISSVWGLFLYTLSIKLPHKQK